MLEVSTCGFEPVLRIRASSRGLYGMVLLVGGPLWLRLRCDFFLSWC